MIMDNQSTLATAQAVTASAGTTDYYDQGAIRDLGVIKQMQLLITVNTAATASGAATVQFQLQCDDNTSFSSPKTVLMTDAVPKAELIVGKQIFLPLPIGLDERYVRGYFNVGTGPLTAGAFSVAVVHGIQKSRAYADAI